MAEETAQIDGLVSGQFDAIDYLSARSARVLASVKGLRTPRLVISNKTGGWAPFTMRVDRTPYSDVRVRTALKLAIDRPAMIERVFEGYGQIGNDVFGIFDKAYDRGLFLQRHQDLEQAKSLLKAAGYPDLGVQLITTANAPGEVLAADVFADHASGAGIRPSVVNQPLTPYFASPTSRYPSHRITGHTGHISRTWPKIRLQVPPLVLHTSAILDTTACTSRRSARLTQVCVER